MLMKRDVVLKLIIVAVCGSAKSDSGRNCVRKNTKANIYVDNEYNTICNSHAINIFTSVIYAVCINTYK